MFSGIIENIGAVRGVTEMESARRIDLDTGFPDLALGESVAVNGVCLTVVETDGISRAAFFVSAETLDRSNLGKLRTDSVVNLERSVTLATRLSGHMVQGHVDGVALLSKVVDQGESHLIELSLPADLHRYCVEKGSITLNGVSLTLNGVEAPQDGRFRVKITLIPHTWIHTNFKDCPPDGEINVEVDVMAKYVERLCLAYLPQ